MIKLSTMLRIAAISLILTFCITERSIAQKKNENALKYISKYSHIAVDNMNDFGIPASITMAQGLLESGFGLSNLAKKSNNHFGIKCKKDWKGDRVYHTDDAPDECFRKYDKVEDSYSDHARFLSGSPRYAALFKLRYDDYKGWAYGLRKAGYATNPRYPESLINIVELYELHKLDNKRTRKDFLAVYSSKYNSKYNVNNSSVNIKNETPKQNVGISDISNKSLVASYIINGQKVYKIDQNCFTILNGEDSYATLSKKVRMSKRRISKYNNLEDLSIVPEAGTKVYLRRKK